jgi:hypothetical protein
LVLAFVCEHIQEEGKEGCHIQLWGLKEDGQGCGSVSVLYQQRSRATQGISVPRQIQDPYKGTITIVPPDLVRRMPAE